jgi:hypothetical protein
MTVSLFRLCGGIALAPQTICPAIYVSCVMLLLEKVMKKLKASSFSKRPGF